MKKYTVYKHTCPNGKVYIGQTAQDVKRRWNNGTGYKENEYFYRAIKKYGWNNIKHEILFENLTQDEADQMEIALISQYKATDRSNGYNRHLGGQVHDVCSIYDMLNDDYMPYNIIKESELLTMLFNNIIKSALGYDYTETTKTEYYENGILKNTEIKEVVNHQNASHFAICFLLKHYSDCEEVKAIKTKLTDLKNKIEGEI